jgi:YfiH family protein
MARLICPDIFDGCVNPVRKLATFRDKSLRGLGLAPLENLANGVKAFFTSKSLGADINKISNILSIKKEDIFLPIQRHTDKVLVLESDLESKVADAVVTKRKGILIGVQVADCVPILLFDRKKSIIGSVHAGWRGTAAQIVKKTIKLMVEDFNSSPDDIIIAIGPSIRWNCYYVGYEVKDAVCKATGNGKYHVEKTDGRYCIDLSSANMLQALSMNIPGKNIWSSNECTYCNPDKYYSYRYSNGCVGRQGGFIGIF